jgi:hypothetical protein
MTNHTVDLNVRRYAENWIKKYGPQTRGGLLNGFKETFSPDLAEKAIDDLFRHEYLLSDNDGMIHWAETYERPD